MARAAASTLAPEGAMSAGALGRRLATTVVAIPLVVWIVAGAPAWLFPLVVVLVGAGATYELIALLKRAGHATLGALVVALGALVTASFASPAAAAPLFALVIAAGIALAAPLRGAGVLSVEPAATALMAIVYVDAMLGHAIWLHRLPDGPWLVVSLLIMTWVGETAAYLVGSTMGRHKLAPVVSPNKTIEGAGAQVLFTVAAAVAVGAWLLPAWSVLTCMGAGVLVGIVGQVGDLAESAIKRSAHVKDAGGLIPGHGGLLDRLDSLVFNVPAFFYYVVLTGGRA
jgi:phosphatidate cytidylyltransferase